MTDGGKGAGGRGVGGSHAVAEAGLWRLAVARGGRVAVAVRLLRGHGHVRPRREHELGCACNRQTVAVKAALPERTKTGVWVVLP